MAAFIYQGSNLPFETDLRKRTAHAYPGTSFPSLSWPAESELRSSRRNYYRILHLQPEAPPEVIKAAYRVLTQTLRMHSGESVRNSPRTTLALAKCGDVCLA